ncbi:hypothetical protein N7532_006435 [Penicillium argentinense]|uniref:SRR1-like domain-containing protein n=1 Tax=Penicillium argentinense TaxID=1131581 RepID=A0A9W9KAR5_9EURO|nr:uncharacterized protein N7532_006435 [Penicillium argentinense]KAJ5099434.1 hypothetical protein N7532_006435 [Penicillium argentinense]
MPHSQRKKRSTSSAQKRTQVTDNDGWTHVTSGSNVRRVMRSTKRNDNELVTSEDQDDKPIIGPASAPARLTFEELEAQYKGYRERWVDSETWEMLQGHLGGRIHERVADESSRVNSAVSGSIDGIVCIGLGSPSGFLRDGWVDRRAVSMYQLAALECVKDVLSASGESPPLPRWEIFALGKANHSRTTGKTSFPIYAQDPAFNELDRALLESLGMTVVNHPVAFERLTSNTFLFCPGAERKHLEMLLPSNPCFVLGGPLENTESSVIQTYVEKTDSRVLIPFGAQEHAFWMMRLYFWVQGNDS